MQEEKAVGTMDVNVIEYEDVKNMVRMAVVSRFHGNPTEDHGVIYGVLASVISGVKRHLRVTDEAHLCTLDQIQSDIAAELGIANAK